MTIKAKPTYETDSTVFYGFGAKDRLGRCIGAQIVSGTVMWHRLPDDAGSYYPLPDDSKIAQLRFWFRPHATRNGVEYGAWQRQKDYATEEERNEAIQKYLTSACKRAGGTRAALIPEGFKATA